VFAAQPFAAAIEAAGSGKPMGVPPAGACGTGVLYSEDFAASKAAQPFFTALVRAAKDLQGDNRLIPENINIIAAATDVKPEVLRQLPPFTWRPDLAPLPDQLEAMQRAWIESQTLDFEAPIPSSEYTETSFSEAAVAATSSG
jgi:NitT/TauT family transport system substrate-binding protein